MGKTKTEREADAAQKAESIAKLRKLLKPGDTVHTILRHVDKRGLCPYCEEEYRKPHGYIYLGDGACEAVYRLVEAEGSESDG